MKLDWYGREAGITSRAIKKQLVRVQRRYNWHWLRSRGRHDIAHASNEQRGWGNRTWSLHDYPRKGYRARLLGRVERRIHHEDRARHSHEMYAAEKAWRDSSPAPTGSAK